MNLGPFTTKRVHFEFYFPDVGTFEHFPSNLSIGGKVIARGDLNKLKAVKEILVA